MEYYTNFTSSNISKIGYEANQSLLEVSFHNGGTYHYYDIPPTVWEQFKVAESQGKFLAEHIKGHYRYSKV